MTATPLPSGWYSVAYTSSNTDRAATPGTQYYCIQATGAAQALAAAKQAMPTGNAWGAVTGPTTQANDKCNNTPPTSSIVPGKWFVVPTGG
jgi:hypothetical protein